MIILGDKKIYTIKDLGQKLGLPPETINEYIKAGRLKGKEIAGEWYVPEESLNGLLQDASVADKHVFVARQPILDLNQNVLAYELLFRTGFQNYYDMSVPLDEAATTTISSSFLIIGMDQLTDNKKAFINLTRNLLVTGVPLLLPRGQVVVEILENVAADADVVKACTELKKAGFMLALDDFIFEESLRPLVDLADIIKVDFLQTTGNKRREIISQVNNPRIQYLAEKVETLEDFEQARKLGYTYFQGYFFSKPLIIQGKDIPSNKINFLRLIREVNKPAIGFEKLEEIIKHDLSLSYKLLRLINSPFFGFTAKIESIRHALVLLGEKEIRKWASLLALSELAFDKPQELVKLSILRARFCEALAPHIGLRDHESDCFLLGMFSLIDTLIGRPMQEILQELPLAKEIKQALFGTDNVYRDLVQLVIAYERGIWHDLTWYAGKLNLHQGILPDIYLDAVTWANKKY